MIDSVTVEAPAKINLGLKVYPKRADGYHNIESIFCRIKLADLIKVSLISQKDTCIVKCENMVLPENNTFTATYKAFCVLTGVRDGVLVEVTKHIPAGGGLGGGSSDASSFLNSIDRLFCTRLSSSAYDYLSGQIGSDVFFFSKALMACKRKDISSENDNFTAIVGGRGEVVTQIAARNDFSLLLVLPGVSVSTKVAYTLVDETIARGLNRGSKGFFSAGEPELSLEQIYKMPVDDWTFVNDFTKPVVKKYPVIGKAISDLKSCGASFADMSGSGSTVFGIFKSASEALRAQSELSGSWRTVLA